MAGIRSNLYRLARLMGDAQAIRRGRVGDRIARRMLGKVAGQILRALTK